MVTSKDVNRVFTVVAYMYQVIYTDLILQVYPVFECNVISTQVILLKNMK
jgi:hypothetical protein